MNQPKGNDKFHSKIRHGQAVNAVYNDILDGSTYSVLYNKLINDEYGLDYHYSQSMAQKIITEARKQMKKDYEEALPQMRETLTNICLDILTEAKTMGDRHAAIKAVQEVAKLCGAYSPQQVQAKIENYVIDFKLDEESTN